ncbi:hypothetical protein JK636_08890 [Clostridium sp. YIM B02515]|uniref:Uncharacterized protein n=1 Tax=Clostridium rhizosphaerae TaxID=2803861 RepID=A0ABS1T987_9CLOT|nr:hypothetical protein [Clostridium rhizosphaerae]MBL4935875.1 hypothetical protein [Clostridium rhizosphaerae]
MKDEMLKLILGIAVTLLLFSLIGFCYVKKGTAEYVVSILSVLINLFIITAVAIIIRRKNKK